MFLVQLIYEINRRIWLLDTLTLCEVRASVASKPVQTKTARPVPCARHAPYHDFLVHVNWQVDLTKESSPLNVPMTV